MFHRRSIVPVLAASALALTLAGCGGSSDSGSSSPARASDLSSSEGAPAPQGQAGGSGDSGSDGSGSKGSGGSGSSGSPNGLKGSQAGSVTPAALQAERDQLARRAAVAVQVANINQAVAKVRATTAAVDGFVLSENIGSSTGATELRDSARVTATTYGEITISVPSTQLDKVVADLSGLGKVIRSTSTSENVGSQIVDTQSRLETMRTSVERVRAFLADADDLTQIVALEAELTRRQSDLESLQSQLAALKGSVARSPVQVSLTTEPGVIAEPEEEDQTGFLVGLKGGWTAFSASVAVALTVVGALLPFAVLAAIVLVPMWLVLRRRRSTPATTPATAGPGLPQ